MKPMIYLLMLSMLVFSVYAVEQYTYHNETCYQEQFNVSTDCGGLNTGFAKQLNASEYLHNYASSWVNAYNTVDANYSSYGNCLIDGNAECFMNLTYMKPQYAIAAIWQIKNDIGTYNLTIPSSCFDRNDGRLSLLLEVYDIATYYSAYSCFSGNFSRPARTTLNVTPAGTGRVYEEAIFWILAVPTARPQNDVLVDTTEESFISATAVFGSFVIVLILAFLFVNLRRYMKDEIDAAQLSKLLAQGVSAIVLVSITVVLGLTIIRFFL